VLAGQTRTVIPDGDGGEALAAGFPVRCDQRQAGRRLRRARYWAGS
jgi:hypothetical protein